jgi:hypothetical protein
MSDEEIIVHLLTTHSSPAGLTKFGRKLDGLKPSSFSLSLEQMPAGWPVGWQRPGFAPRFRFWSTLAPGAIQCGSFGARKRFAELNDVDQLCVHRVIPVSSIKTGDTHLTN